MACTYLDEWLGRDVVGPLAPRINPPARRPADGRGEHEAVAVQRAAIVEQIDLGRGRGRGRVTGRVRVG